MLARAGNRHRIFHCGNASVKQWDSWLLLLQYLVLASLLTWALIQRTRCVCTVAICVLHHIMWQIKNFSKSIILLPHILKGVNYKLFFSALVLLWATYLNV